MFINLKPITYCKSQQKLLPKVFSQILQTQCRRPGRGVVRVCREWLNELRRVSLSNYTRHFLETFNMLRGNFYNASALQSAVLARGILSVRPSVCPSACHVPVLCPDE